MTSIRSFFRLNYTDETALESMLKAGTAVCRDPDFALSARPGDGVVLAHFDEAAAVGKVRAIGLVTKAASDGSPPGVHWVKTSLTLFPTQQGMRFWRQPKPFFVFAKNVAARYRLQELFCKTFSLSAAKPVQSSGQNHTQETTANEAGAEPRDRENKGGYVYLIRSPYGYKIGKTKNMKERSQLFTVKLPFSIEIVHYAWHADYSMAERLLHQRFRDKRLNGEWFALSPKEINEIMVFRTS